VSVCQFRNNASANTSIRFKDGIKLIKIQVVAAFSLGARALTS
jgi:hypothetical protein